MKHKTTIKIQENQVRELRGLLVHIDRELKDLKGERKLATKGEFTFYQWLRWGCANVLVPIMIAVIGYLAVRDGAILGKAISNYIGMP